VTLLLVFLAGAVRPRPTHALSSATEITIIAAASIAALALVAVVATALTRDNPRWLDGVPPGAPLPSYGDDERVRFGAGCPGGVANPLTVCW
jgi:hypothetical protein